MKVRKKYIDVSEFGFVLTPEMFLGLKVLEDVCGKTILSLEAVEENGTNLLTMFPVVADEYYFFFEVFCCNNNTTTQISFTAKSCVTGGFTFFQPLAAWDSEVNRNLYLNHVFVLNLLTAGFTASGTWSSVYIKGIKINTS